MTEESKELVVKSETGILLQMAIDKNLDADKLEKLINLKNQEEERRAEKEFEFHFAEMQKDYIPAYKKKSVHTLSGNLAYKYCPLPQILAIYAPILSKHGFSYRWEETETADKKEKATICFLSGHGFTRSASIVLPYDEGNKLVNSIQARGVTSEYGRRYTFMNVTGCIVADETDTDGRLPQAEQTKQEDKSGGSAATQIKEMLDEMGIKGEARKEYNKLWRNSGPQATLEAVSKAFNAYLDNVAAQDK